MNEGLERISLDKKLNHPLVVIREHLIRYTLALQNVKDKNVLDIACGTGYGMYLMSYWAKSVSGYDKEVLAIREAKQFQMKCKSYIETRNLETVVSLGNIVTQKFDVITCFETLEHLKNPEKLISLIEEHLSPKGVFYFSVPNKKDLKDDSKWHQSVFNKDKIIELMRNFQTAKHGELWGQDQWGLAKDLKKPWIVGRLKT